MKTQDLREVASVGKTFLLPVLCVQNIQVAGRSTNLDMTTVFLARVHGRFVEIKEHSVQPPFLLGG